MKSILTFPKWTKKMSKIGLSKTSLLTDFFCDDIEIYGLKLYHKFIFVIEKKINIFWKK